MPLEMAWDLFDVCHNVCICMCIQMQTNHTLITRCKKSLGLMLAGFQPRGLDLAKNPNSLCTRRCQLIRFLVQVVDQQLIHLKWCNWSGK